MEYKTIPINVAAAETNKSLWIRTKFSRKCPGSVVSSESGGDAEGDDISGGFEGGAGEESRRDGLADGSLSAGVLFEVSSGVLGGDDLFDFLGGDR